MSHKRSAIFIIASGLHDLIDLFLVCIVRAYLKLHILLTLDAYGDCNGCPVTWQLYLMDATPLAKDSTTTMTVRFGAVG